MKALKNKARWPWVLGASPSKEMTFEQRPEQSESRIHGENVPSRGKGQCRDPEAGVAWFAQTITRRSGGQSGVRGEKRRWGQTVMQKGRRFRKVTLPLGHLRPAPDGPRVCGQCVSEALWLPWSWATSRGWDEPSGPRTVCADQTPRLVPKVQAWHPGARQPPLLALFSCHVLLPIPSSPLFLLSPLFPPPSPSLSLSPESTFQPRGEKQGRLPSSAWQGSRARLGHCVLWRQGHCHPLPSPPQVRKVT